MTAEQFALRMAAHAALLSARDADVKATLAKVETTRRLGLAVRAAFAAGVAPKDIVAATGLSRTRIYEIRDGK